MLLWLYSLHVSHCVRLSRKIGLLETEMDAAENRLKETNDKCALSNSY